MYGESLSQEYRRLSRNGECVCDFDVACAVHPRIPQPHDVCEYAGYCSTECSWYRPDNGEFANDAMRAAMGLPLD